VEESYYTPGEALHILARTTGKPLTGRDIRQMLQVGELEGFKDEEGRWHVAQYEIHRLLEERRDTPPLEAPESPQEAAAAVEDLRTLERQLRRLEGRLELSERQKAPSERRGTVSLGIWRKSAPNAGGCKPSSTKHVVRGGVGYLVVSGGI
jgi:hypothetical protein